MSTATFNFDEIDIPERTVTLGGHTYRVLELTHAVASAMEKLEHKFGELDEDAASADQVANMLIEVLACRLEATNGGPPALAALKALWKDGKVSLERIRRLAAFLNEGDDPPA
jgi:hypothetical protein